MHYYFTVVSLVAGICLGFGILYLFIGLRRKANKPLNLTFALFALCYATTLFNGIRWYSTTTVTEYIAIIRFDSIFVAGAFVGLIWYIAYFTGVRPHIFLGVLSVTFIVPSLVFIFSPATVAGEVSGLTYIALPWGETLANLDATGSVWLDAALIARLVALGFIIVALVRQFWRGERRPALILGLGVLPFIAGIFYEILGESGVVPYIPLGEFGFLGIAIAASLQMANSVIRTEEELGRHRQNLAGLVEVRTAALNRSNEQLSQEIVERRQTELVLRQSEERFRKVFEEGPLGMAFITTDYRFANVNSALCRMLGYTGEELTALTYPEITHPEDVDNDVKLAQAVFADEIPFYQIEKRYLKKNKEELWANLTASVIRDDEGHPIYGLAMIGDISERRRAEQALNRRIEELAFLHQTAQTVANVTDLPATLQTVSEMMAHLFEAWSIHFIISETGESGSTSMVGFSIEKGAIEPTPLDLPLAELPLARAVLRQKQSLAVSDVRARSLPPRVREFLINQRVQGLMLVPLVVGSNAVGLMSVATDKVGREFTVEELRLAETLAGDIAAAVENARLLEEAEAAGAAQERSRIARELHDSVTQTLYSVSIVAEALPRVLERNLTEAKRNAAYLRQTTLGALAEMRTLLFELRPESLAKANLNVLLQQLADALTGRTRIPVDVTLEGKVELPAEVKIALYRIAQEAFNNVRKHAKATHVRVTLRGTPDQVILAIGDNGQGFAPESVPEERLGLRIMRERAEEIGAGLKIDSQPGQGAKVLVSWSGRGPGLERVNEE